MENFKDSKIPYNRVQIHQQSSQEHYIKMDKRQSPPHDSYSNDMHKKRKIYNAHVIQQQQTPYVQTYPNTYHMQQPLAPQQQPQVYVNNTNYNQNVYQLPRGNNNVGLQQYHQVPTNPLTAPLTNSPIPLKHAIPLGQAIPISTTTIPINQNINSLPKYYIENPSTSHLQPQPTHQIPIKAPHHHFLPVQPNSPIMSHNSGSNNTNTISEVERLKMLKLDLLNQLEVKRKKKEIFQFTPIELFAVQEVSPSSSGQMYFIVSLSKDNSIDNYPNHTRIENISANLASAFGYEQKEMIGSNLANFFPDIKDENLKEYREEISRISSTKSVTFLKTKEFGKHKNGSIITLNSNTAIFSGDNGKPSILLSFVKQITVENVEDQELIPKFEIISEKK